jgi:putative Mg2+ transporter-C (MgtC) family protein
MTPEQLMEFAFRVGAAFLMGGLIGLERELHGRPAGLRTHMLVCAASALLMQITVEPIDWLSGVEGQTFNVDASRVVQGIMAGVGFLGAGEIFRHGWNVRGLTTAASIWITAALGVVAGLGLYAVAAGATVAIVIVLVGLNWLELHLPVKVAVRHTIRFAHGEVMEERELRELLRGHGFDVAEVSQALVESGRTFEYRVNMATRDRAAAAHLAQALRGRPDVREFNISIGGE